MSLTRLADDIIAPFVTYRCTMYHRCIIASCRKNFWVTRYRMHFPGVSHATRPARIVLFPVIVCILIPLS